MSWCDKFQEEEIFLLRDYSQLEIRILAQYSQDKLLCQQLNTGKDIHVQVGYEILGWPKEVVEKDGQARVLTKGIHFEIIYNFSGGWEAIWEKVKRKTKGSKTKISKSDVEAAYKRYFKRYSGVAEWLHSAVAYTTKHEKSLPTLYGQTRPIYIDADYPAHGENQAVNTPIQGSAGAVALHCLALIRRNPKGYALLRYAMRNEIHDSLVSVNRLCELYEANKVFKYLMEVHCVEKAQDEFGIKYLIPLVTDAKVGFRFGTMVKFDPQKQKSLEEVLNAWCEKNESTEKDFYKDPMRFVDLQRGVIS